MGLITYTPIEDGNEANMALFNTRFLALHNVINGSIDSTNLANDAVTGAKLAIDSVTTAKIADSNVTAAKLANNAVTAAKIEAQQSWVAVTYQNGWTDYGGGYNPAAYMKDSLGFVHLRGLVKSGVDGSTIFTLPTGYRPQWRELLVIASADHYGRLDIPTDGTVIPSAGVTEPTWVCLDGVTFKAAN